MLNWLFLFLWGLFQLAPVTASPPTAKNQQPSQVNSLTQRYIFDVKSFYDKNAFVWVFPEKPTPIYLDVSGALDLGGDFNLIAGSTWAGRVVRNEGEGVSFEDLSLLQESNVVESDYAVNNYLLPLLKTAHRVVKDPHTGRFTFYSPDGVRASFVEIPNPDSLSGLWFEPPSIDGTLLTETREQMVYVRQSHKGTGRLLDSFPRVGSLRVGYYQYTAKSFLLVLTATNTAVFEVELGDDFETVSNVRMISYTARNADYELQEVETQVVEVFNSLQRVSVSMDAEGYRSCTFYTLTDTFTFSSRPDLAQPIIENPLAIFDMTQFHEHHHHHHNHPHDIPIPSFPGHHHHHDGWMEPTPTFPGWVDPVPAYPGPPANRGVRYVPDQFIRSGMPQLQYPTGESAPVYIRVLRFGNTYLDVTIIGGAETRYSINYDPSNGIVVGKQLLSQKMLTQNYHIEGERYILSVLINLGRVFFTPDDSQITFVTTTNYAAVRFRRDFRQPRRRLGVLNNLEELLTLLTGGELQRSAEMNLETPSSKDLSKEISATVAALEELTSVVERSGVPPENTQVGTIYKTIQGVVEALSPLSGMDAEVVELDPASMEQAVASIRSLSSLLEDLGDLSLPDLLSLMMSSAATGGRMDGLYTLLPTSYERTGRPITLFANNEAFPVTLNFAETSPGVAIVVVKAANSFEYEYSFDATNRITAKMHRRATMMSASPHVMEVEKTLMTFFSGVSRFEVIERPSGDAALRFYGGNGDETMTFVASVISMDLIPDSVILNGEPRPLFKESAAVPVRLHLKQVGRGKLHVTVQATGGNVMNFIYLYNPTTGWVVSATPAGSTMMLPPPEVAGVETALLALFQGPQRIAFDNDGIIHLISNNGADKVSFMPTNMGIGRPRRLFGGDTTGNALNRAIRPVPSGLPGLEAAAATRRLQSVDFFYDGQPSFASSLEYAGPLDEAYDLSFDQRFRELASQQVLALPGMSSDTAIGYDVPEFGLSFEKADYADTYSYTVNPYGSSVFVPESSQMGFAVGSEDVSQVEMISRNDFESGSVSNEQLTYAIADHYQLGSEYKIAPEYANVLPQTSDMAVFGTEVMPLNQMPDSLARRVAFKLLVDTNGLIAQQLVDVNAVGGFGNVWGEFEFPGPNEMLITVIDRNQMQGLAMQPLYWAPQRTTKLSVHFDSRTGAIYHANIVPAATSLPLTPWETVILQLLQGSRQVVFKHDGSITFLLHSGAYYVTFSNVGFPTQPTGPSLPQFPGVPALPPMHIEPGSLFRLAAITINTVDVNPTQLHPDGPIRLTLDQPTPGLAEVTVRMRNTFKLAIRYNVNNGAVEKIEEIMSSHMVAGGAEDMLKAAMSTANFLIIRAGNLGTEPAEIVFISNYGKTKVRFEQDATIPSVEIEGPTHYAIPSSFVLNGRPATLLEDNIREVSMVFKPTGRGTVELILRGLNVMTYLVVYDEHTGWIHDAREEATTRATLLGTDLKLQELMGKLQRVVIENDQRVLLIGNGGLDRLVFGPVTSVVPPPTEVPGEQLKVLRLAPETYMINGELRDLYAPELFSGMEATPEDSDVEGLQAPRYAITLSYVQPGPGKMDIVLTARNTIQFTATYNNADGWVNKIEEVSSSRVASDIVEGRIRRLIRDAQQIAFEADGTIQFISNYSKNRVSFRLASIDEVETPPTETAVEEVRSKRYEIVRGSYVQSGVPAELFLDDDEYMIALELVGEGVGNVKYSVVGRGTKDFTYYYNNVDGWVHRVEEGHETRNVVPSAEMRIRRILQNAQQIAFEQDGMVQFISNFGMERVAFRPAKSAAIEGFSDVDGSSDSSSENSSESSSDSTRKPLLEGLRRYETLELIPDSYTINGVQKSIFPAGTAPYPITLETRNVGRNHVAYELKAVNTVKLEFRYDNRGRVEKVEAKTSTRILGDDAERRILNMLKTTEYISFDSNDRVNFVANGGLDRVSFGTAEPITDPILFDVYTLDPNIILNGRPHFIFPADFPSYPIKLDVDRRRNNFFELTMRAKNTIKFDLEYDNRGRITRVEQTRSTMMTDDPVERQLINLMNNAKLISFSAGTITLTDPYNELGRNVITFKTQLTTPPVTTPPAITPVNDPILFDFYTMRPEIQLNGRTMSIFPADFRSYPIEMRLDNVRAGLFNMAITAHNTMKFSVDYDPRTGRINRIKQTISTMMTQDVVEQQLVRLMEGSTQISFKPGQIILSNPARSDEIVFATDISGAGVSGISLDEKLRIVPETYMIEGQFRELYEGTEVYPMYLYYSRRGPGLIDIKIVGRNTFSYTMDYNSADGWVNTVETGPATLMALDPAEDRIANLIQRTQQIAFESDGKIQFISNYGENRVTFDAATAEEEPTAEIELAPVPETYTVGGKSATLYETANFQGEKPRLLYVPSNTGSIRFTLIAGNTIKFGVNYNVADGWVNNVTPALSTAMTESDVERKLTQILLEVQQLAFEENGTLQFIKDNGATRISFAPLREPRAARRRLRVFESRSTEEIIRQLSSVVVGSPFVESLMHFVDTLRQVMAVADRIPSENTSIIKIRNIAHAALQAVEGVNVDSGEASRAVRNLGSLITEELRGSSVDDLLQYVVNNFAAYAATGAAGSQSFRMLQAAPDSFVVNGVPGSLFPQGREVPISLQMVQTLPHQAHVSLKVHNVHIFIYNCASDGGVNSIRIVPTVSNGDVTADIRGVEEALRTHLINTQQVIYEPNGDVRFVGGYGENQLTFTPWRRNPGRIRPLGISHADVFELIRELNPPSQDSELGAGTFFEELTIFTNKIKQIQDFVAIANSSPYAHQGAYSIVVPVVGALELVVKALDEGHADITNIVNALDALMSEINQFGVRTLDDFVTVLIPLITGKPPTTTLYGPYRSLVLVPNGIVLNEEILPIPISSHSIFAETRHLANDALHLTVLNGDTMEQIVLEYKYNPSDKWVLSLTVGSDPPKASSGVFYAIYKLLVETNQLSLIPDGGLLCLSRGGKNHITFAPRARLFSLESSPAELNRLRTLIDRFHPNGSALRSFPAQLDLVTEDLLRVNRVLEEASFSGSETGMLPWRNSLQRIVAESIGALKNGLRDTPDVINSLENLARFLDEKQLGSLFHLLCYVARSTVKIQ